MNIKKHDYITSTGTFGKIFEISGKNRFRRYPSFHRP